MPQDNRTYNFLAELHPERAGKATATVISRFESKTLELDWAKTVRVAL
jgi:hypothetical protein